MSSRKFERVLIEIDTNYIFPMSILNDLMNLIRDEKMLLKLKILKWILDYKNYQLNLQKNKEQQEKIKYILNNQELVDEKRKDKEIKLKSLKKQEKKDFPLLRSKNISEFKEVMKQVYLNQDYIKTNYLDNYNEFEIKVILNYLGLLNRKYKVIIVDEAQDFEKEEIEYIRLLTDKIFLTGDMLQNLDKNGGLEGWNDILFNEEVFGKNSELNIFNLKHNYRQTYQLANASFNFRNILLKRKIEDIGDDYFENEKKFGDKEYFKPKVFFLKDNEKFYKAVQNTLNNLLNTYTNIFPLVIIVKDIEQKNEYLEIFRDFNIKNTSNPMNNDVLLFTIDEIKGEQFPIVFADISNFNSKEIYLTMSRAQFELNLYFRNYDNFEKPFYDLITNNLKLVDINENVDINKFNLNNTDIKYQNSRLDNDIRFVDNKKELDNLTINESNIEKNTLGNKEEIKKLRESLQENQGSGSTPSFIHSINNETIITDEKKYKDNIIKENENIKSEFKTKTYTNNKIQYKENLVKIEEFLYKEYEGHCQICGDTFAYNGKNCFELKSLNFGKDRDVNRKGNSLCLCHKHHAIFSKNIQKNIFLDNLGNNNIDIETIKKYFNFHEFVGLENINENNDAFYRLNEEDDFFRDVYFLPIKLFSKIEYIKFTEAHILEFIEVWNEY